MQMRSDYLLWATTIVIRLCFAYPSNHHIQITQKRWKGCLWKPNENLKWKILNLRLRFISGLYRFETHECWTFFLMLSREEWWYVLTLPNAKTLWKPFFIETQHQPLFSSPNCFLSIPDCRVLFIVDVLKKKKKKNHVNFTLYLNARAQ